MGQANHHRFGNAVMQAESPAHNHNGPRRSARWLYWIMVPFCGLTYSAYCTWFLIEAWGGRGAPRPAWFDVAYAFALPGMFLVPIPVVGSFMVGGLAGFLIVLFIKRLIG